MRKFGNEALKVFPAQSTQYTLKWPIQNSAIEKDSFELMEKMILDVFENKLGCDPNIEDVFIVDSPSHSKAYRNNVARLLFEQCRVQSLNFLSSTTLALFSTGRTE